LRDIEEEIADIVLNNRVVLALGTKNTAFLTPVQPISLNFVTKKSLKKKVRLHFHLLQAFDRTSRVLYGVALITTVVAWNFMNFMRNKTQNINDKIGIMKLAVIVISIQSSVSVPVGSLKSLHHKILLTVLLIFALIKCNAFQGSVVSRLSSPPESNDINNLDQLLDSDLKLLTMISIPNLFTPNADESNVNEVQKKIYQKQTMVNVDFEKVKRITYKQAVLRK
jgi:hypothetical protein